MPPRARKSTGASSSRGNEPPIDADTEIATQVGAPFFLSSYEEAIKYQELAKRPLYACRFLDWNALESLEVSSNIHRLLAHLGWTKFETHRNNTYRELTLEFFTTLHMVDADESRLRFRLNGKVHNLNYNHMYNIFGFPKGGAQELEPEFKPNEFWEFLTGESIHNHRNASNTSIRDPCYVIIHKFLCHAVFGRKESSKVSQQDLFFLWCMHNKHKINTSYYVMRTLYYTTTHAQVGIGLGHLVTSIARYFGEDASLHDLEIIPSPGTLGMDAFGRARLVEFEGKPQFAEVSKRGKRYRQEEGDSSRRSTPAAEATAPQAENVPPPQPTGGWEAVMARLDEIKAQGDANHELLMDMDERLRQVEREQAYYGYKLEDFAQQSGFKLRSPSASPPHDD